MLFWQVWCPRIFS